MDATDRRSYARQAIQNLAAELGLPTELTIISERWNTVARLGTSEVIAKAATLASLARIDPLRWFQQDVRVSVILAAAGAPVHVPWAGTPTAYSQDDLPITLWKRIEGETAASSETELLDSLAAIHRLGRSIVLDQPWFAPITTETPATLEMLSDRGVLSNTQRINLVEYLKKLLDDVVAADLPQGLVHGDAQRKNSLHTSNGPIWIDFEEVCIGPLAWDIACLTMNPQFDTNRALDRYAQVSGTGRISLVHLDVLKQLRALEGLAWMLAIQDEREPTFRAEAAAQLSRLLLAASGG